MTLAHCILRLWPLLLFPLLSACNPFSSARPMMDEYVERVARVLETEPRYSPVPQADQIPRRRDRVLEMPDLELGMLDFLSLYGCELQHVVGEKNSVMGRVMQPLNRLRYELRFIHAARACIGAIDDEDLKATLKKAIESKRKSLPIAVWNGTWGVEEVETLFTLAKGSYPVAADGDPVSDLAREISRLDVAVKKLVTGDLDVSLDFAGEVQQRWQAEYRAGQLINSANLLVTRLRDATRIIRARLDDRPLCLNGKPNNQSDIVKSMFFSVYVEKVQPYLADVRRARDELMVPLGRLATLQQATMPGSFREWYERYLAMTGEGSLWRALDEAMSMHTKAWQDLLGQCGLRPGA
ncbi:hypothetical protein MSNKSG1_03936 [Marinobacter santoriniensis NKSG1]|uniref:DUF3080 domain-containing protein n=1 Tax=Marinobacter santoriniensis NKSG1 TaxID=1288826 RepID=M7DFM2_9GAMM|nr:DUF3080 domain-containing protein [Marinobacter santoriniensis]EMP56452.1 hypothetical protein MSNKSG1_03936 [Marinobacter santoriniensis NKSG1]